MGFTTINPASGEMLRRYPFMSEGALDAALTTARNAQRTWAAVPVEERARIVAGLAAHLRQRDRKLAEIVTMEMGKPLGEAVMEVDKCASGCEHYGEMGAAYLGDQVVETESHRSYVTCQRGKLHGMIARTRPSGWKVT